MRIFLFKECKFRLGSYQYRAGKIRFSLEELVKDVERQNVLLEYLRLEKLQVCFSSEEFNGMSNVMYRLLTIFLIGEKLGIILSADFTWT